MRKIYLLFILWIAWLTGTAQSSCQTAVSLPENGGIQVVDYVSGVSDYWYKYTAEEDLVLTVMYCGTSYVNLSAQFGCDEQPAVYGSLYCDPGSYSGKGMRVQLTRGKTVYIHMNAYASFDKFEVSVRKNIKSGGASCGDALALEDGDNYIPSNVSGYTGTTWVSYTPEKTGILTLTCSMISYLPGVTVHSGCEDQTGKNPVVKDFVVKTEVTQGQTVYLKFSNTEPVDAKVECVTVEEGSDCSMPVTATEGDQVACNAKREGDHWYRFTSPRNGYLEVSACRFDTFFDGSVSLYADCTTLAKAGETCPEGSGFYLRSKVEQGREYKININTKSAAEDDFSFSVHVKEPVPGDDCSAPVQAARGENTCSGRSGDVWFQFTPSKEGYLEISNCGQSSFNGYITLYTDCNQWVASSINCPDGGAYLKATVRQGVAYQIKWTLNSSAAPFHFSLSEADILRGDHCSNPIPAKLGENELPSLINGRTTYYSYTASKEGWMEISVCRPDWFMNSSGRIEVKSDCNSIVMNAVQQSCENGSGVSHRVAAQAGESYLICLTNTASFSDDVTFTLSEKEFMPGDVCSKALPVDKISEPVNVEKTTGSVWYTFTTGKEGFYTVSSNTLPSSGSGSSIQVKTGDCAAQPVNASFDYTINTYRVKMYVGSGVPVFVNVNIGARTTNVSWNVTFEEAGEGEVCSKPIRIGQSFTCPAIAGGGARWYAFEMPKSGTLEISACGTESFPRMSIYQACDGNSLASSEPCADYSGNLIKTDVRAGNSYLLEIKDNFKETEFSVVVHPAKPGSNCDTPIEAVGGENDCSGAGGEIWYSYTPSKDGYLQVSNCGQSWFDGNLTLFTDCSQTVAWGSGCDQGGSYLKAMVRQGTDYQIKWTMNQTVAPFRFTLEETDLMPGDACLKALPVDKISDPVHVEKSTGSVWYTFTAEKEGFYTISSNTLPLGGNGTSIQVKAGDCDAQPVNASYDATLHTYRARIYADAGVPVFVNITIGSTANDVSWNVTFKEAEEGETCSKPIPVGDSFTCPALANGEKRWYAVNLPQGGKLEISACGTQSFPRMNFFEACNHEALSLSELCSDNSGTCIKINAVAGKTYLLAIEELDKQTRLSLTLNGNSDVEAQKQDADVNAVHIYPNPSNGLFTVGTGDCKEECRIEISTMNGQIIYRESRIPVSGKLNIKLSHKQQGVYLLKLIRKNNTITRKIYINE